MKYNEIADELVRQVRATSAVARSLDVLPVDQSLYESGILDSFGVVELVDFIEKRWSISILDAEITKENFGGINKMATLISAKLAAMPKSA
jgi:acyl carrier protein